MHRLPSGSEPNGNGDGNGRNGHDHTGNGHGGSGDHQQEWDEPGVMEFMRGEGKQGVRQPGKGEGSVGDPTDPMRVYLSQIGEIPLFRGDEETQVAARKSFHGRQYAEALYGVAAVADDVFQRIRDKDLTDRLIDFSPVTAPNDRKQAEAYRDRGHCGLVSLVSHLIAQRDKAMEICLTASAKEATRFAAWKTVQRCKLKIARLLREMSFQEWHIHPYMDRVAAHREQLRESAQRYRSGRQPEDRMPHPWIEYRDQLLATCETPASMERRWKKIQFHKDQFDRRKQEMVRRNLRLVVHRAKKYRSSQVSLMERIECGNFGLIRGVEKFDHRTIVEVTEKEHGTPVKKRKRVRFSTYATNWVNQSIQRGMADCRRTIRVPAHATATLDKIRSAIERLAVESGITDPTDLEIVEESGVNLDTIEDLRPHWSPILSTDSTKDNGRGKELNPLEVPDPKQAGFTDEILYGAVNHRALVDELIAAAQLDYREREVIKMRKGIDQPDGIHLTLEEVGEIFSVTRERVRQLEGRAVLKMQAALPGVIAARTGMDVHIDQIDLSGNDYL